jgi:hypothetical protein
MFGGCGRSSSIEEKTMSEHLSPNPTDDEVDDRILAHLDKRSTWHDPAGIAFGVYGMHRPDERRREQLNQRLLWLWEHGFIDHPRLGVWDITGGSTSP